ncbi:fimbrial protein [Proteus mirabilis]|nr:type 1 fimbrial protein [Proteus mirabilis]
MKKVLLSLAMLSIISTPVLAKTPAANLKINGDIKPPTCTINGGNVDLVYNLGNISPSVIPNDMTYNQLPSISNTLTVTCDTSTFLTFRATDGYPNSFIQTPDMNINFRAHAFNLVDSADTSKTVGGITYRWKNVTVDEKDAYLSRANDGSYDNGNWSREYEMVKGATVGWTAEQQKYVSPDKLNLLSGKAFKATFYNDNQIVYNVAQTYLHSKKMLTEDGIDLTMGLDYTGQVILAFNFGV